MQGARASKEPVAAKLPEPFAKRLFLLPGKDKKNIDTMPFFDKKCAAFFFVITAPGYLPKKKEPCQSVDHHLLSIHEIDTGPRDTLHAAPLQVVDDLRSVSLAFPSAFPLLSLLSVV